VWTRCCATVRLRAAAASSLWNILGINSGSIPGVLCYRLSVRVFGGGAQRPDRTLSMNFAIFTEDVCVSFSRSSTSPLLLSTVEVTCLIISCTLCGVAQLPLISISRDWRNCAAKSASVGPIGGAFAFTGLGGFGCASSSYRSNSLSIMEE